MRWFTLSAAMLISGAALAHADLVTRFAGYDAVWETGTSGSCSSYYTDTKAGLAVSGPTTGTTIPTLSSNLVSYPSGVGQVPSPGGSTGAMFDEGVLGVKVEGGEVTVMLASRINPQTGVYHSGYQAWYGQGDVFLDLADSDGVSHFALLNAWPRANNGNAQNLNNGQFTAARNYHLTGGLAGASLEGYVVALENNSDVSMVGGTGAYTTSNAPAGLDMRAYARGGSSVCNGHLAFDSLVSAGQTWYVETWTLPVSVLSADRSFDVALHAAASCGNDQIGKVFSVPEPSSLLLVLLGSGLLIVRRHAA